MDEERADLERVLEMADTSATLIDLAPELFAAASLVVVAQGSDDEEVKAKAIEELRKVVQKGTEEPEPTGVVVSAHQVDVVAEWLMEVTIGRPTTPPSSSSNGGGPTSNGSKATSRARAKAGRN